MRRILVDGARRKQRPVRGGEFQRVELDEGCSIAEEHLDQVLMTLSDHHQHVKSRAPLAGLPKIGTISDLAPRAT